MTVPVGAAGVRGLGGRGYLAYASGVGALGRGGSSGASYNLKVDKQGEEKLYELLPGMELTPMSTAAMNLKAAAIKPSPQVRGHRFTTTRGCAWERKDPTALKTKCSCERKKIV